MRFCLGTEKPPTHASDHLRALLGKPMGKLIGNLVIVTVSDHVILENHTAHPRQSNAPRLDRIATCFKKLLSPLLNLFLDTCLSGIMETPILPVPMGAKNPRPSDEVTSHGTIKISGKEKSRHALHIDLLDSESITFYPPVNHRIEGITSRFGIQAHGNP